MATKPVTVGVDGSEQSLQAVEWAALEARRHAARSMIPWLCLPVIAGKAGWALARGSCCAS
jgi:hypothetical protein